MLTKGDDYPIHQMPEPIAYAGTDRNFYDRYFFNGYSRNGNHFFAVCLGVYPHLNIIDASFCVIEDGIQHNIHASRLLHMERMDTRVGPISIEVIEPLKELAVSLGENEYGITADLTFKARSKAIEEPRFTHRVGPRTYYDYTRMTQNGTYSGWIHVKGRNIELSNDRFLGTRDRSWGIRPVGAPDSQPVEPSPARQFYWLWAPLNFDNCCTFYHINADEDGRPWNQSACYIPVANGEPVEAASSKSTVVLKSGTRHAQSAVIDMNFDDRNELQIILEPQFNFYMTGLGYRNPEWGHGLFKGEHITGYDSFNLNTLKEPDLSYLHVQAFCKALIKEGNGREQVGAGVLEQLILGPHKPSGFKHLLDVAP